MKRECDWLKRRRRSKEGASRWPGDEEWDAGRDARSPRRVPGDERGGDARGTRDDEAEELNCVPRALPGRFLLLGFERCRLHCQFATNDADQVPRSLRHGKDRFDFRSSTMVSMDRLALWPPFRPSQRSAVSCWPASHLVVWHVSAVDVSLPVVHRYGSVGF